MSRPSDGSPWPGAASDFLSKASAVLAREGGRLQGGPVDHGPHLRESAPDREESLIGIAARICPVTGAALPLRAADQGTLRRQAHELVAALLGGLRRPGEGLAGVTGGRAGSPAGWALPMGGGDGDRLRRQAHELIETLLMTFSGGTGQKEPTAQDQVPLLRFAAPVQAGHEGSVVFHVINEEATPSEVTLYCTDFISDSGHEIPALRVTVLPRRTIISPKGEAAFEIKLAVPQQTPAGHYSGLIQAMGNRFVKAVLMVGVT